MADNEYAKLVEYLETHQQQERVVEEIQQKVTTKNTKKLLEECSAKIHADIPLTKSTFNSEGFDVHKFESLMRSKLIDDHKRGQTYERPFISVTELTSCLRKSYYSRMKYQIDISKQYQFSYLYLINHVGNTVHEIVQNLYDHTEVEKTIVSDKYKIKGRVDGIRDKFLLEYKTIDRNKFKNAYIADHFVQGNIYAFILNSEYNYKIHTVTVVYFTRDLKGVYPFDIPVAPKEAQKYIKRAPILLSSIERKSVPEPLGATTEQCKWCPYKSYCEKDTTELLQPFEEKKKVKKKSVFLL